MEWDISFLRYLPDDLPDSDNDAIDEVLSSAEPQGVNNIGEIIVEPDYDPSKRRDGDWRYASLKFGKVTFEQLRFWTDEKFAAEGGKEFLESEKILEIESEYEVLAFNARLFDQYVFSFDTRLFIIDVQHQDKGKEIAIDEEENVASKRALEDEGAAVDSGRVKKS
ncbi:DNA-directed RNA polymerase subunit beta [Abeliophyllum distichum]|uniref:DNA-directed RNA polymerase subunit beta n=1 Tax=Abeliophyllum distichum TaxID=126358 RepID=A0ABD1TJ77_9LAMI